MSPFQGSEKAAGVNTDSYTCHCVKGNPDFTQWTQMYGFDTVGSFVLTWGCKAANECVDDWGVSRGTQIHKNNTDTSATTRSLATTELKRSESFWQCWMTWMCEGSRGMMKDLVVYKPLQQSSVFTTHMHHLSLNPFRQSPILVNLLMCAAWVNTQRWRNWFDSQEIFKSALEKGTQLFRWSFGLKIH